MKKIWFDTDIGNDIDDTAALAYLLKQPDCELLGISTVSGQSPERAMLADVLCRAAGRTVGIYAGTEEPLLSPQRQGDPHQKKYLPGFPHHKDFPRGGAIEAMYKAIAAHPGEVTLLAVGPMTNVALLLSVHPDAASLLKELVVMCGEFFGLSAYRRLENEWNAFCDPYAAAIVYRTPGLRIRSAGLDVTSQVVLGAAEVKERFSSPLMQVVYAFSGIEEGERDGITFHDPLAAADIFRPGILSCRSGTVSVELSASRVMGRTYFDAAEDGLHLSAHSVDKDAFFREYFTVVNA